LLNAVLVRRPVSGHVFSRSKKGTLSKRRQLERAPRGSVTARPSQGLNALWSGLLTAGPSRALIEVPFHRFHPIFTLLR
jgi:hypothetical protein